MTDADIEQRRKLLVVDSIRKIGLRSDSSAVYTRWRSFASCHKYDEFYALVSKQSQD